MAVVKILQALKRGPGPQNIKEALSLFFKGICMGCADIVPGVSGGTVALITGIYEQLLAAISSTNDAIKQLVQRDIIYAAETLHTRFLVVLLGGIGISIIGLARVMHYLLAEQPVKTWSLFFGLIAGSILLIGKNIQQWRGGGGLSFLTGTIAAFLLVGMIPVSTPETFSFIFFSGMIAICAMILPGISGSFLLLIMGKYQFITGAIKNPFEPHSLAIIAIFGTGCIVGLLGFSKILTFFLNRYHNITIALLTGLMCGSMRKIWPWKETLDSIVVRGKSHVLSTKNVLPPLLDSEVCIAMALAVIGFFFVFLLQRMTKN